MIGGAGYAARNRCVCSGLFVYFLSDISAGPGHFCASMFKQKIWTWLCALIVTVITGCNILRPSSGPGGAPHSPPLRGAAPTVPVRPPAAVTLNHALGRRQRTVVNSSPIHSTEGAGDAPAIYTRQTLLQLRNSPHILRPPNAVTAAMQRLGIARKRRGIRGGRKSRRPIPVVTTDRVTRDRPAPRSSVLSCPRRLTVAETRAISRPPPTPRDGMLVCYANVRSLTAHFEEVTALIDCQKTSIIFLTETWLTDNVLDSHLAFSGYTLHRADRSAPRKSSTVIRGGGVAILTSDAVKTEHLNIRATDPAIDSLWLMATYRGRSAVVGVLYRPPDSPLTRFISSLHDQLLEASATGRPLFLFGDMNIDVSRPDSSGVAAYSTMLSELNLCQLVREPTHLRPTPTILDHIITNQADIQPLVRVLPEAIGDHQPVTCAINLPKIRLKPEYRETRRWDRADWSAICLDLLLADWEPMHHAVGTDSKLKEFMVIWDAIMDRHCPMTRTRTAQLGCPWLRDNVELRALMEERDVAREDWLQYGTEDDHATYRQLRNRVKSELARARKEFLCDQLAHRDHRGFWKRLKQFAVRSNTAGETDSSVLGPEQGDIFNEYFSSVGARVAGELRSGMGAKSAVKQRMPRPVRVCSSAFVLKPVTLPELSAAVRQMSSSAAVGLDGVPMYAVRQCFAVIGPELLHVINASIVSGMFPSMWKTALVVPLHKSGDVTVAGNFRPISLLSVLSKVTERVVCNQLTAYLQDHSILSDAQYAYRRGRGVEDALIDAVEWMSKNIDSGRLISITALDLSKAFDSIDHGVLLSKMGWYGIPSHWFASYLGDRKQMVRGGASVLPVSCGVPQGSILGPVLFCLVVNEAQNFLPHGRLISYADDTQLFDCSPKDRDSMASLKNRLEESIMSIQKWLAVNSLKMNPTKTEFTLIGTRQAVRENATFYFEMSGHQFKPSEHIKVLGVVIDQCLRWDSHVTRVVRRCTATLISLYRFRRHFSTAALLTIIRAHVFSHILFCLPVWASASGEQRKRIQKVINFAARVVTGTRKTEHITPVLRSLGWQNIEGMIFERDCIKVFNALNDQYAPNTMRSMFTRRRDTSLRDTRLARSEQLALPRVRLSTTQRVFSYRAATAWNTLPPTVTQSTSRGQFMVRLGEVQQSGNSA